MKDGSRWRCIVFACASVLTVQFSVGRYTSDQHEEEVNSCRQQERLLNWTVSGHICLNVEKKNDRQNKLISQHTIKNTTDSRCRAA